jgi:pilus assembly protein CpaC
MNTNRRNAGVLWRRASALLLCGWFAVASVQAEELVVVKGASAQVPVADGIRRIVIGNPAFIDARPTEDGKAVVVNGLAEGTSEMRIERMQGADVVYSVSVRSDLHATLDQIKELLSEVEGIEIKVVGNKVVLKGNLITKSGYDRKTKVVEAYSGVILDMTTFDRKDLNKYVEAAILADLKEKEIESVTVKVMEDTAILDGTVFSEADKARAEELAKQRVPKVTSFLKVQEVMIETDVEFVQVNTDNSTDFGHNVLKTLEVTAGSDLSGTRGSKLGVGYGVSATAKARINALIGNGNGKVIAQPHLSTKSGGEGSFQSGGVTYFSVAGNVGGNLERVEYGVILKVKPTLQGRERIVNEVTVEVSVPTGKAQGTFSLDKFETKSTAMCKPGESMVLSGLVQTLANRFQEKTPLLGDIPLLNLFFSEKGRKTEKKELVVLITPTPVFPQAASGQPFSEERVKLLDNKDANK